ncbi:MAG: hypothetical protein GY797_11025 [Deltaproteobacteria bacterium]|nr:hypothetical protein [Deltaproteobacteria bacterium]
MISQILWYLIGILFLICFLFIATFCFSFFVYIVTKGRVYQEFKQQPKRFLFGSLAMGIVFGFVSMMPNLSDILLSPMMIEPVNIYQSLVLSIIGFFLVVVIGSPIVWLSYNLAIPLAHKFLHNRI